MQGKDPRAVEDPIAAIFDLAGDVTAQTPKIRRLLRFTRVFVSVWLFVDFWLIVAVSNMLFLAFGLALLLFVTLFVMRFVRDLTGRSVFLGIGAALAVLLSFTFGAQVIVGIPLVALFYLGMVILGMMRELREFFDYFAFRHRVVEAVREADPVVHIPPGANSAQRILHHLAMTSAEVRGAMSTPAAVHAPAMLPGASGLAYEFDAYIQSPPGILARAFGLGDPGFAVFVKAYPGQPPVAQLEGLRRAAEDISARTRIPPARVIAVWTAEGDVSIPPETYEFLTSQIVRSHHIGAERGCSLELATETADGTYDFIPVVAQPRAA